MNIFIYILIIIFGTSSYVVGIKQMLNGKYSPSTFSRIVWVLLAINSFFGLLLSDSTLSSIILGAIFLIGNIAICLISFWKGTREIGYLEYFCIALLIMSATIWILFEAPLVNLCISLFAHFVGALPTYKKVWHNPSSESAGFWSLFFIASVLSVFATESFVISTLIFPIYFTVFDGSMFFLSIRKTKSNAN